MKGQLRIDIPGYDPQHAAGKPYTPATYSKIADASRISIKGQALEYARFIKAKGIKTLYLYPEKKTGNSVDFRRYLRMFLIQGAGEHWKQCTIVEVEPDEFLGGVK